MKTCSSDEMFIYLSIQGLYLEDDWTCYARKVGCLLVLNMA